MIKFIKEWHMTAEGLKAFHGWCTAFWIPFTILSYYMKWLESIVFVSVVSMLALFLGSFSAWQAARAEVTEKEKD